MEYFFNCIENEEAAVIALDLAARHPEQISALIAHEPPVTYVLSSEEQVKARQIQENLENISRR